MIVMQNLANLIIYLNEIKKNELNYLQNTYLRSCVYGENPHS